MIYIHGKTLLRPCDLCHALVSNLTIQALKDFTYPTIKPAIELCDLCDVVHKSSTASQTVLDISSRHENIGG